MSTSNWDSGKKQSNYHFDWLGGIDRQSDYGYVGRIYGDWEDELLPIIDEAVPTTWRSRGKDYTRGFSDIEGEENDLKNAGMSTKTIIMSKHREFTGKFKEMVDCLALENGQGAFHIMNPGDMLNLHIDKQYEHNEDYTKVGRYFIFLRDWEAGHFIQMGNEFLKWKKGDVFWFDWKNIPHASANAGWTPRCMIQYTGTITDKTPTIGEPIKYAL